MCRTKPSNERSDGGTDCRRSSSPVRPSHMTGDRGWITNWTCSERTKGEVSLAYLRRIDETTGALVMLPSYAGVAHGIYPGVPGGLALDRFRSLDDVRFRVSSAEEEWAYA